MIGLVLTILMSLFVYGCGRLNTYNNFGFSFDYPDGMRVEEEGYPFFSAEANEEAGVLKISKPQLRLYVSWVTLGDVDRSHIEKQMLAYLSGRSEDHTLYLTSDGNSGHQTFHAASNPV